jgi:hypothetical protein
MGKSPSKPKSQVEPASLGVPFVASLMKTLRASGALPGWTEVRAKRNLAWTGRPWAKSFARTKAWNENPSWYPKKPPTENLDEACCTNWGAGVSRAPSDVEVVG